MCYSKLIGMLASKLIMLPFAVTKSLIFGNNSKFFCFYYPKLKQHTLCIKINTSMMNKLRTPDSHTGVVPENEDKAEKLTRKNKNFTFLACRILLVYKFILLYQAPVVFVVTLKQMASLVFLEWSIEFTTSACLV